MNTLTYLVVSFLAAALLLSGCSQNPTGKVVDTTVSTDTSPTITGPTANKVTVTTDQGQQVIETRQAATGGVDSWCQKGAQWSSTGTQGDAKMVIQGIESTGKYSGYCHVTYDISSPDSQGNIDMYFNQEGSGYQVMDINGQKYETAWSK